MLGYWASKNIYEINELYKVFRYTICSMEPGMKIDFDDQKTFNYFVQFLHQCTSKKLRRL